MTQPQWLAEGEKMKAWRSSYLLPGVPSTLGYEPLS